MGATATVEPTAEFPEEKPMNRLQSKTVKNLSTFHLI